MYLDVHDMYIETENKSLKDPKPFNMQIYQAFSPVISLIDTNNWTVISYIHNLIYFPYILFIFEVSIISTCWTVNS